MPRIGEIIIRTVATYLLAASLAMAGCGGGDDLAAHDLPFAQATMGGLVYEVNDPYVPGEGRRFPKVEVALIAEIATIEGVADVVGTIDGSAVNMRDSAGELIHLGLAPVSTWTEFGFKPPIEQVEGKPPGESEFVVSATWADEAGLVIGETYELSYEGTRQLTLSGTIWSQYVDRNMVLLDSESSLEIISPNGAYDRALVMIDAAGDPARTLGQIAELLPEGLELSERYGLGVPEPVGSGFAGTVCDYLDGGGNSLIKVIDMAKESNPADPWGEANAAGSSLGTICPQWEQTDAAVNLVVMAAALEINTPDIETGELIEYWSATCTALQAGTTPEAGPGGISYASEDEADLLVTVTGVMGMCPEQVESMRQLIESG